MSVLIETVVNDIEMHCDKPGFTYPTGRRRASP